MKGWRNQAPESAQVDALTALALARIRETARLPRRGRGGHMESAAMAQARGAVDLAIIGAMADGGHRDHHSRPARNSAGQAEHPVSEGRVFGLTGESLANRIRAAAKAAGLGDGYNGHSGRIGMARRMVAAGAPNAAVQHQGRWRHGDMVARYTRGEAAGEALKWLS